MGGVASMFGDEQQAQADEGRGLVDSAQGAQSQTLLNMEANYTTSRGAYQAGVAGIHGSQAIARQNLLLGSSGVDTQNGTAGELGSYTRELTALDQAMIRTNAARAAWGLRVKGYQQYLQGQLNALGDAENASNARYKAIGDMFSAQGQALSSASGAGLLTG